MSLGADPTISAPNPGQVGSNFNQLLSQLYQSAPGQYQEQATYQPAYTDLGLQDLNEELMGNNGTSGLLANFLGTTGAAGAAQTGANANLAGGNINNIAALAPGANAAENEINPNQNALLDNLSSTANSNLALGTTLDPGSVDQTLNTVNQNWSNRGLGGTAPNELSDALQLYSGGQNLLATRENQAENAAGTVASDQIDPTMSLLTQNSTAPNIGTSLLNTGQSVSSNAGPTLYNTGDLESLMNTVYNQQAASNISQANDQAAITSQIIGGVAGMGGSL